MHLLMDRLVLIFLIFASGLTFGQKSFPMTVDPSRNYRVLNQDSVVEHFGEMLAINADFSVVNFGDDQYNMYDFRFAKARSKGDTIYIHVHEANTLFKYDYDLKIVKDKFLASFLYETTIDTAYRKIETVDAKLILKNKIYKKGTTLIGYTEYSGRCVSTFDKNEEYKVRGTFRVKLE
jgi:hypothetical protein